MASAFHDALLRRLSIIQDLGSIATQRQQNIENYRSNQAAQQAQSAAFYGGSQQQNFSAPEGWRSTVLQAAQSQVGLPYIWGGSKEGVGFDCSGLVQYAYGKAGIKLPRVSNAQAMTGVKTSIDRLQPGDLVAWDNSSRNRGADHIAIYAGNGTIIEAPGRGKKLRTRRLGANENAWGVAIQR